MNYIDIKEAVKATGKSEKTIRRLLSKSETKPFLDKIDNKILIDVNYLFSIYPPIKIHESYIGQRLDIGVDMTVVNEIHILKNKITLYEQELKYKNELLSEKDERIVDLQKAIFLLEAPKRDEHQEKRKKKWWKF